MKYTAVILLLLAGIVESLVEVSIPVEIPAKDCGNKKVEASLLEKCQKENPDTATYDQFWSGVLHGCVPVCALHTEIEVVFVLDTTGSMSSLIEGAKEKIWSIVSEIASHAPQLKVGLIGYRDHGDDYVTKRTQLSTDIDSIYAKLTDFEAEGGGDFPEAVNEALYEAVTEMKWSKENTPKIVFVVGDAPPHMDNDPDYPKLFPNKEKISGQQTPEYPESAKKAKIKGIRINTILMDTDSTAKKHFKQLASLGGGVFSEISQTGDMKAISTPMDEPIVEATRAVEATVLPYGNTKEQQAVASKIAMAYASSAGSQADRAAYMMTQTAGGYNRVVTGKGDLLMDLQDETVKLAAIATEDLPVSMQKLDLNERTAYIESKLAARTVLQEELDALVVERREWMKENVIKNADSFDEKIKELVLAQLAPTPYAADVAPDGIVYVGDSVPMDIEYVGVPTTTAAPIPSTPLAGPSAVPPIVQLPSIVPSMPPISSVSTPTPTTPITPTIPTTPITTSQFEQFQQHPDTSNPFVLPQVTQIPRNPLATTRYGLITNLNSISRDNGDRTTPTPTTSTRQTTPITTSQFEQFLQQQQQQQQPDSSNPFVLPQAPQIPRNPLATTRYGLITNLNSISRDNGDMYSASEAPLRRPYVQQWSTLRRDNSVLIQPQQQLYTERLISGQNRPNWAMRTGQNLNPNWGQRQQLVQNSGFLRFGSFVKGPRF